MTENLFAAIVLLLAGSQMLFFNLQVGPSTKKVISFWLFWFCFVGALALTIREVTT